MLKWWQANWIAIGTLAFASAASSAEKIAASLVGEPITDTVNVRLPLNEASNGGTLLDKSGRSEGSRFVQLELAIESATPLGAVQLELLDAFGVRVETVNLNGISGTRTVWTKLVPGPSYRMRVLGPASQGAAVTIRSVLRTGQPAEILSANMNNMPSPISLADSKIRKVGRAVAQIVFQAAGKAYSCTGFLIGPTRLVTNQHCIADQATCDTAIVMFDRDSDRIVPGTKQRHCRRVTADAPLDIAVLELDEPADPEIVPLVPGSVSPRTDQALLIIQHPGGGSKQVAQVECRSIRNPVDGDTQGTRNTDFTHSCGTWLGASGAPVLDAVSFELVGLHHLGIGGSQPKYNRAVRIESIRDRLTQ